MAREGLGMVIGLTLFSAIMVVGAMANPFVHLQIMAAVSVVLTLLTINFFRDPDRQIPDDDNCIISPADGKVIEIVREREREYFNDEVTRISVFLNIFDVHVNRIPISGKVTYFRYQKGAFLKAYKSEASEVNEQTIIGIENGTRKVLFKQIAGLIARRIVCNVREGNNVTMGERFGMIKFGSRVDILLPQTVDVKVNVADKVKGGESIIGVFTDEIQS